jgi:hypothetical protein
MAATDMRNSTSSSWAHAKGDAGLMGLGNAKLLGELGAREDVIKERG